MIAPSDKFALKISTSDTNYMKSFGVLTSPVDHMRGVYFHHCAIAMSCLQLAKAGRFLAHGGRHPSLGHSRMKTWRWIPARIFGT